MQSDDILSVEAIDRLDGSTGDLSEPIDSCTVLRGERTILTGASSLHSIHYCSEDISFIDNKPTRLLSMKLVYRTMKTKV
jgi:hypothetical protein